MFGTTAFAEVPFAASGAGTSYDSAVDEAATVADSVEALADFASVPPRVADERPTERARNADERLEPAEAGLNGG